ncbi:hypothetical protein PO909_013974 [Leuciscus waleckii]
MRAEGGGEERGGREGLSAHSQCAVSPHFSLFPSPHFHPHLRNSAWLALSACSTPLSSKHAVISLSLLLIFPRRPALCQHGEQITAKLLNMGSCFYKGHQELQSGQQHPMEELHSYAEGQPIFKGNHQPYNGSMSDKRSSSGYDIGELATSSLLGLLATFKDHITKPTAMAQGRVAHLIEWKSWGGEAASRGGWCGGWGGVGAALQEDEQLYSHLTDEIKEARFAAGEKAFIYLTCSYQVSNIPLTLSIKLQPCIKVYTVISRLCYLMLLTSSALRKMKDRGRIFPSFLSTLTTLLVCLLVTC